MARTWCRWRTSETASSLYLPRLWSLTTNISTPSYFLWSSKVLDSINSRSSALMAKLQSTSASRLSTRRFYLPNSSQSLQLLSYFWTSTCHQKQGSRHSPRLWITMTSYRRHPESITRISLINRVWWWCLALDSRLLLNLFRKREWWIFSSRP